MLKKLFGFFSDAKLSNAAQEASASHSVSAPVTAQATFETAFEAFDRGDITAALDLYARVIELDPKFEKAHVMSGFLFKELGNLSKAQGHLVRAIELNPKLADAWYLLGSIAAAENDTNIAVSHWQRSLEILPSQEQIYSELSYALYRLKQVEEAVAVIERGLQSFPRNIGMLQRCGNYYLHQCRYADAIEIFSRAIELSPNSIELIHNYVVCCIVLRKFDEAFSGFARISLINADYAPSLYLEGTLRLKLGDFAQGWKLYEHRWQTEEMAAFRIVTSKPKWDGSQTVSGKTILIVSEQGYGDSIQFCRFIPLLEKFGAKIIFVARNSLFELMQQVQGRAQMIRETDSHPPYDYYCELMSLPLALGVTKESIPASSGYLRSVEQKLQQWRERLAEQKRRFRVGLVWAGNPMHTNNFLRSIPFEAIKPLLGLDLDFTVLQTELSDLEKRELQSYENVHFYGDEVATFTDTAALVDLMDLVVTVDTSVAHLAGAMGKPTWVLLSYHSDWRWMLDTEHSPWYDSVRLFRQELGQPWGDVVQNLTRELADKK